MHGLKNKNDYSVTVYKNHQRVMFTQYVHSIYAYCQWLQKIAVSWDYIVVYIRRTRQPLCFYKSTDPYIDNKPNFRIRGHVKKGWA